jgi:D-3-phosphoglycerate dehydrogenase
MGFRVGITRDFLDDEGTLAFGDISIGLELLDAAALHHEYLAERHAELTSEEIADYDALLVLGPRISRATLEVADRLAIVSRFGVGYDSVDVGACTEHGVAVTITPDGVRRPVATAALTLVLALSQRLPTKDRMARESRWSERNQNLGYGLTGRTLGVVGFGNIGRELCRLVAPLDMHVLASDPFGSVEAARQLGVELIELGALLEQADYVVVCAALTPETRHLIGAAELARMKPTSFLVNVGRGPLVDQKALTEVLREGRIRGAGLDVFDPEPTAPDEPLLALENVILSPHSLSWTDESFSGMGRQACGSIISIAGGNAPTQVVNREVLDGERFQAKLRSYRQEAGAR